MDQRAARGSRFQAIGRLLLVAMLLAGFVITFRVLQPGVISPPVLRHEQEVQFNRQLDQYVKLDFGRPVMLQSWIDEWSRQTGITVELRHPADLTTHEVSTSEVMLDLPEVPARRALDSLGERYGAAWEQQRHERIILHWYRRNAVEMQGGSATFPAPDFLAIHYPT